MNVQISSAKSKWQASCNLYTKPIFNVQNFPMKRTLVLPCVFLFANFCRAQLLSWATDFPKDNDNVTITVDATKGNQGLLGFAGNVYVHTGVITNLSTDSSNWRYSKFTWGSTDAAALATPAGTNKWSYTINNIRTVFGVPAGETILKIAILFRAGNCTDCLAQNLENLDMIIVSIIAQMVL